MRKPLFSSSSFKKRSFELVPVFLAKCIKVPTGEDMSAKWMDCRLHQNSAERDVIERDRSVHFAQDRDCPTLSDKRFLYLGLGGNRSRPHRHALTALKLLSNGAKAVS